MKKNIIVFAGSNSQKSINKQLVTYAAQQLQIVDYQLLDLNDFIMPLYGIDHEIAHGMPEKAVELSRLFEETDGFLISLAEHNGSYTVAFKNVFDWLSRIQTKVWRNKPMLLLSTAPGGRGGLSVMETAVARFPRMGANITGNLSIPFFAKNFSEGQLINEDYQQTLIKLIQAFEAVV